MELDIDAIHVSVTGDGEDEEAITREVQRHLQEALDELSRSEKFLAYEGERLRLDLGEIDWERESDRTGAILRLLRNALEETP